jgi:N-dimethylarginine dimethylaminohydrolase
MNIKVSCTECYVPVVMSELERKSEEQVVEEWVEDMGEGAGGYGEIW